jgi:hypothetical protein
MPDTEEAESLLANALYVMRNEIAAFTGNK